jgi:hypothetical protein
MVRTLDSHPKAVPWVLGKPLYVVTGPQAYCEVRMDHFVGQLHILLVEKEERIRFNIVCLIFKIISWWCLSVLESIMECTMEICLAIYLEI